VHFFSVNLQNDSLHIPVSHNTVNVHKT